MERILFLGATCVDVIINIDHLPTTGEDLAVHQSSWQVGGCAYNASQAACQLGLPYLLYSPIGTGPYGKLVYDTFQQQQLPTPILRDQKNGCCYCLVEKNGERTFMSEHGTEYRYTAEDLDALKKEHFAAIYVSGLEIEENRGDLLIDYLSQTGDTPLFFAPGPRISHIPRDRLERLYALSPILHLNESEACWAAQTTDLSIAMPLLYQKTGRPVVVTLGKNGACFYDGKTHWAKTAPVDHPVDTIGAGDGHIGMLMGQLYLKQPWPKAIARANQYARAIVQTRGSTLSTTQYQHIQWEEEK